MAYALPIPDEWVIHGARRIVIGEPGDPTRTDVRPCEYLVTGSALYPGRPAVTARVGLSVNEREAVALGADLILTLDAGEVPWSIGVTRPPEVGAS